MLLAAPAAWSGLAQAQEAPVVTLPADPCLRPPQQTDLRAPRRICPYAKYRQPAGGRFEVLNGVEARPADYPALFYYFGHSGPCTASLVASRVMVTARHCVADGQQLYAPVSTWSHTTATATCSHVPFIATAPLVDIALCHLNRRLPGPYERINRDPTRVIANGTSKVTIVGFGCGAVNEPIPEKPVFRHGSTTAQRTEGGALFTSGGAAVCLGDSGGPAFIDVDAATRFQVAVNSEGVRDGGSWLALTSVPEVVAFIDQWSKRPEINQRICGYDVNASNCR